MDRTLSFLPNRRQALWGVEEWLVSAHPAGMSMVADGAYAGRRRGPFAVGGAEYPEGSSVLVLPGSSFEIAPGSQVLVTEVARAF